MALPITYPHPVIGNPIIFRAQAALPAAGAFDPAPLAIALAGFRQVMLYITYDRNPAAAAGAVTIRPESSPYAADAVAPQESWFRAALYAAAVVVAGADTVSIIQREDVKYTSVGAAAETFLYGPISLAGVAERLRIACAESGEVANPGTVEVIGVAYE